MAQLNAEVPVQRLSGRLGVISIVFMVVAAAAPLTVVSSNAPLAIALGNGIGAPYAFIVTAVVLALFAVGFVTMTPFVKDAGAFFSYVTLGLGRRLGNATAAIALVSYTAIQLAVWGFLGVATNNLVTSYVDVSVDWWVYALVFIAITAVLGYRHIELSAKVLGVALVAEILVVVVYDLVVVATAGASTLGAAVAPVSYAVSPGMAAAITFAIAGFMGFEATVVFRDEARDPDRTIPRATYISVALIGVFYALSTYLLIAAVGPSESVSLATTSISGDGMMLINSMKETLGPAVGHVVQVLLITSLLACALSFHNVIARYGLAMANRGLLPKGLATIHPRHQSPSIASLAQSISAAVLLSVLIVLGLDPIAQIYGFMAGVAAVGFLLLMLLASAAVVVFFARPANAATVATLGSPLRTRIVPGLAVIALTGCLVLVLSQFTLVTALSVPVSTVIALVPVFAGVIGLVLPARAGTQVSAAGSEKLGVQQ
jgi:amino acid transporter